MATTLGSALGINQRRLQAPFMSSHITPPSHTQLVAFLASSEGFSLFHCGTAMTVYGNLIFFLEVW
jgi:hypothetical protein